jgi:hypothetical protein
MRRLFCVSVLGALGALGTVLWCIAAAQNQQRSTSLKLVQTIELPGVTGRIDHLAMDVKGNRLFVAALGNKTVEVVDFAAGKVVHTISGLKETQGIFYSTKSNQLFEFDGQLGTCRIYDGSTYKLVQRAGSQGRRQHQARRNERANIRSGAGSRWLRLGHRVGTQGAGFQGRKADV